MVTISPFRALRPAADLAKEVASRPYDVLNSQEARAEANGHPDSFLHITKSEIDLPDNVDIHTQAVYEKAKENLQDFIRRGTLFREEKPAYYIYQLVMNGRSQTGLVCGSSVDDYEKDLIKKHEFTRPEKEQDRINHIKTTGAQTGNVFLAYRNVTELDKLIDDWKATNHPAYLFTADDEISHTIWIVDDVFAGHVHGDQVLRAGDLSVCVLLQVAIRPYKAELGAATVTGETDQVIILSGAADGAKHHHIDGRLRVHRVQAGACAAGLCYMHYVLLTVFIIDGYGEITVDARTTGDRFQSGCFIGIPVCRHQGSAQPFFLFLLEGRFVIIRVRKIDGQFIIVFFRFKIHVTSCYGNRGGCVEMFLQLGKITGCQAGIELLFEEAGACVEVFEGSSLVERAGMRIQ